jgi:hypothetical protein
MLGRLFGRLEAFTKRSPDKSETVRAQRRDSIKKREELLKRTISEIRGTTIEEVTNKSTTSKKKYPSLESSDSESDSSSDSDSESSSDSDSRSESVSVKQDYSKPSNSKNQNTMEPLLREFGLEAYASAFRECGFDTPVKVSYIIGSL